MSRPGVLSRQERRTLHALSAIHASRVLGLYMVLPVLSPHAQRLHGATSLLIGLSLGAYGMTQAIFQIPFGALSDRIGRRRTINLGLLLFAAGSFLAAAARDARLLVLARGLQGSGAITSAVVALIADLTRAEVRTQAMAQVGMWIGVSIAVAIVVGPTIAGLFGVPVLFVLTGIGAVGSILYVALAVPDPPPLRDEERLRAVDLPSVLKQRHLLLIDFGILLLHTVVTVLFVVMPFALERILGSGRTWVILVPAVALGIGIMAFVSRWSDRHHRTEAAFFLGVALLAVSCLVFAFVEKTPAATLGGLLLFVVAIAVLEPVLVSLLSRFAPGPHRGTATGVFSMAQFGGTFVGGLFGGAVLHRGQDLLFLLLFLATVVWGIFLARAGKLRPSEGAPPA